jgi:hypothetical protein
MSNDDDPKRNINALKGPSLPKFVHSERVLVPSTGQ